MKRTFITALVLVLISLFTQPLRAQMITLRLGHVGFPGSLFAITTDEYAKRANDALKGKVEIKVFHSSQLGSDEQMMRGIKVGAPEMVAPSTVMSTVDAKFGVFEMPYLIVSRAHMRKVAENKQVQDQLFERPADKRNQSPWSVGKWVSSHHQQRPSHRQAGRSERDQAESAGRSVAGEHV